MNHQTFHDELKANGFDEAVGIDRPVGYAMGEHQHPFDACALITAGDITLVVEGVSRHYRVGDVFRLPAGTLHLEAAGPEGVSFLSGRRSGAAQ
jgi:quercetin dioxygenase-like cupin family protein